MRFAAFVSTLLLALPAGAHAASGVYDAQLVLNSVAEGKAAAEAIKVSFRRRQTEIDARKTAFEKLQRTVAAEEAGEKREGLKLELGLEQEKLKDFFARQQRELHEEEKAATDRIIERVGIVAGELRVAKGLDALLEKPPKGRGSVAGEDLTGEVIRAYDVLQAAREANAAYLFVHPGKLWSEGNDVLQAGSQLAAKPLAGYPRAYQVNALVFVGSKATELATFRGTIHGWVAVSHGAERRNRDIMPIQLVFAGPKRP